MKNFVEIFRFNQVFFRGRIFVHEDICKQINSLANYISRNIQSENPFILLPAFNHVKTIIAFFAILKTGRKPILVNPDSKSIELAEIIEETDPAAQIFINELTVDFEYTEEIIFRKSRNYNIHLTELEDVCLLMYTNAEDGFSKGAMITYKNILTSVKTYSEIEDIKSKDIIAAYLPFYHILGFTYGVLMPAFKGSSIYIADMNIMKIMNTASDIHQLKVSNLFSVPSLYYLLGKIPNVKRILQNVNEVVTGGMGLAQNLYEQFYKNTGMKIREGYGLTEVTAGSITNFRYLEPIVGSIGQAFPCNKIKLINKKGGECNEDEIGEICIKGDNVFKGFFNNEKATNKVIKNGWFYTGDLATKDKMGYFYFKGLKKNMINVGGNNVYPFELERLLKMNENVIEVKVFKENSLLQGEIVGVNINLKDNTVESQERFKSWCTKNISGHKLPKIWNFNAQT